MATPQTPHGGGRRIGIALGGVALVVTVFLITGLVAPGFLLGDKADDGPGGSGKAAADRFLSALHDDDLDALRAMVCDDATGVVRDNLDNIAFVGIAEELPVRLAGTSAVLPLEMELAGGFNQVYEFVFVSRLTTWCWHDMRPEGSDGPQEPADPTTESPEPTTETEVTTEQPTPAPADAAEGEAVLTDFVDALNSGTQETAAALACADMNVENDVAALSGREVDLKITSTSPVSNISLNGDLTGTIDGTSATGAVNAIKLNSSWCVSTFVVV